MSDTQGLLRDYNVYFSQTTYAKKFRANHKGWLNPFKGTPERLNALEAMLVWCKERKIDARYWLQSLFVSRHWVFPPRWNQLISEKHYRKYQSLPVSQIYQSRIQAECHVRQIQCSSVYDVNRDLSSVTEALKARYRFFNQSKVCLAHMQDETLGYHPKSSVCATCAQASLCSQKLRMLAKFDIVALRQGTISMSQAVAQERATYYAQH